MTVRGIALMIVALLVPLTTSDVGGQVVAAPVPRVWDDQAIASLELPLANPIGSPKHVTSDYYYRIPVAPIYKSYPVYAPGSEPPDYLARLSAADPVVVWDDAGHQPPLDSDADWIRAGEIVFDAPVGPATMTLKDLHDPAWLAASRWPVPGDGIIPVVRYVVKKKGEISLEMFACATCHTRVMPDGTVVKGAQGNFPLGRPNAIRLRADARFWEQLKPTIRATSAVPWLTPDPEQPIDQMSAGQFADVLDAIPPGVNPRHRASPLYPVQIPDLIGIADRRYLDRTGLQPHRSIVDLMRYDAMNRGILNGGDGIANHNGFIAADAPRFTQLPEAGSRSRYSDDQLFALARYLYSLQPPPNPNVMDAEGKRGEQVFQRERCNSCHTPPAYTNNRLTPADGFAVPQDHRRKYDILPVSVGTDSALTLATRRGTGYYKVPSLKGVWYRSMFGHSGWCATLDDWFDPRRLRDDYVPTGFKPYDRQTYAVKGHRYGLSLPDGDRRALVKFLKTL